jgi:hypothetical protein
MHHRSPKWRRPTKVTANIPEVPVLTLRLSTIINYTARRRRPLASEPIVPNPMPNECGHANRSPCEKHVETIRFPVGVDRASAGTRTSEETLSYAGNCCPQAQPIELFVHRRVHFSGTYAIPGSMTTGRRSANTPSQAFEVAHFFCPLSPETLARSTVSCSRALHRQCFGGEGAKSVQLQNLRLRSHLLGKQVTIVCPGSAGNRFIHSERRCQCREQQRRVGQSAETL